MTLNSLCTTIPGLVQLSPATPDTAAVFCGCYTGDLLSDVLAHAKAGDILVTVQAHRNTIAVAAEKQLPAIIFCNSRQPDTETLQLAEERHIALFSTAATPFETAVAISRLLPNAA